MLGFHVDPDIPNIGYLEVYGGICRYMKYIEVYGVWEACGPGGEGVQVNGGDGGG